MYVSADCSTIALHPFFTDPPRVFPRAWTNFLLNNFSPNSRIVEDDRHRWLGVDHYWNVSRDCAKRNSPIHQFRARKIPRKRATTGAGRQLSTTNDQTDDEARTPLRIVRRIGKFVASDSDQGRTIVSRNDVTGTGRTARKRKNVGAACHRVDRRPGAVLPTRRHTAPTSRRRRRRRLGDRATSRSSPLWWTKRKRRRRRTRRERRVEID